jgi:hypothetical protein
MQIYFFNLYQTFSFVKKPKRVNTGKSFSDKTQMLQNCYGLVDMNHGREKRVLQRKKCVNNYVEIDKNTFRSEKMYYCC